MTPRDGRVGRLVVGAALFAALAPGMAATAALGAGGPGGDEYEPDAQPVEVTLETDTTTKRPGERLLLMVGISGDRTADVYAGVVMPSGIVASMTSAGSGGADFVLDDRPLPLARAAEVPAGRYRLLDLTLPEMPVGTYQWYAALSLPSADPMEDGSLLGVAVLPIVMLAPEGPPTLPGDDTGDDTPDDDPPDDDETPDDDTGDETPEDDSDTRLLVYFDGSLEAVGGEVVVTGGQAYLTAIASGSYLPPIDIDLDTALAAMLPYTISPGAPDPAIQQAIAARGYSLFSPGTIFYDIELVLAGGEISYSVTQVVE